MENYKVDLNKKWDYENGFYLTCDTTRIGKLLNHLEIYKKVLDIPGDVVEFGVYKGTSLVRLLSFRNLLENEFSRKIIGFDAFGKFPEINHMDSDIQFIKKFEDEGGYGISKVDLEFFLNTKGFKNYTLIEGNIIDTLPEFIAQNPAQKIALLHIDVDVYEPTKLIIEALWDKVVKGGVLMIDDYSTVEGETTAIDEFFQDKNVLIQKPRYNYIPSFIVKT